jgi:DNA mismatch repair ATPase MutS
LISSATWSFSEVGALCEKLEPLTPYGKQSKQQREFFTNEQQLNALYKRIEQAINLLRRDTGRAAQVCWHLRRIPLIPQFEAETSDYQMSDFFLVKKFLFNYSALCELADGDLCSSCGLDFQSQDLLTELVRKQKEEETFCVSAEVSPDLSALRNQIKMLDAELEQTRHEQIKRLRQVLGLDFGERDFVVIDALRARQLDQRAVSLEAFDGSHVIVRPMMSQHYFDLLATREKLIAQERTCESAYLGQLYAQIFAHRQHLSTYTQAVKHLDIAMAQAKLACELELSRPKLRAYPEQPISISSGWLLSLEQNCARVGEHYQPLDFSLHTPAALIYGSNMSGKTAALKTIASLQLAAQMGYYVPAKSFEAPICSHVEVLGAATLGADNTADGLSRFGREITQLNAILANRRTYTLLIVDEFAHTTNSIEATALTYGLLQWIANTPDMRGIMATHQSDLPNMLGVTCFQTDGMDWPAYEAHTSYKPDISERIATLHRFMRFTLREIQGSPHLGDALRIAQILGTEPQIIHQALAFLQTQK